MLQAWPLSRLVIFQSVSLLEENGAKPNPKASMLPVALWLAWYWRAQGAQRLPGPPGNPVLGLNGNRGLKCSVRSYHGHPSCDTAAEILLKSNVALNSQSPLPSQCQASQPSSQACSSYCFRQGGWNEWNCDEWGPEVLYMWSRWYMWKPKVSGCHSLYYQFSSSDGPGRTVL